jgi:hypothetical protein
MSYFSKLSQSVVASTVNSSNDNLAPSGVFTGTVDSTLNVAGIQVSLKTDQNCTIYVEQSPDTTPTGPHWDISDSFRYFSGENFGITVQAINSYFRVRVINTGSSPTTYFRLQSILCPIVEAVPRTLTEFGSLKTAIEENIATVSTLNCKTNLTGSQSWVGTFQEVYNQSAIQIIAKFSQDFTLYVDQGQDGVNVDITDNWECLANQGFSVAVGSIAPYFRVRLTNKSSSIATGQMTTAATAIFNPLPRKLDAEGNLETCIECIHGKFEHDVVISPMGALKTTITTRLAGASFIGDIVDGNFWSTTSSSGTGAINQTLGTATLTTGGTANSNIFINSVRIARYVGGNSNYYRGNIRLPAVTTGSTGYVNIRRWGVFDVTDGFIFVATQTNPATNPTLSIVCRKSSLDTNEITSGSFNGNYGPNYTLDNNVHTYEIFWTNKNCYFVIDDVLLHTFTGSTATLIGTLSLKVGLQCINSGNNNATNTLAIRSSTINRLGQLLTQPTSYYLAATNGTGTVLKYGAGNLHSLVVGSVAASGAIITLRDGTSASGSIITSFNITFPGGGNFNPSSFDFKGLPFYTGLFLVSSGQNASITVIYE